MARHHINGPLALPVVDPEGGFDVVDTRSGQALAWRGEISSANEVASQLNAAYPPDSLAPAHDSLVHEVRMTRIGGEPEKPLHKLDGGTLGRMVPEAIGGPLDPGLWRPRYGDEEVV